MIFTGKNAAKVQDFAERIVATFTQEIKDVRAEIFGPIPASVGKLFNEFRFAVLIKTLDLEIVRGFLKFYGLHKSPDVQIDFDPLITN